MYRHTSTSGASCVRRWAGSPAGSPSRAARQASPETAGRRYSAGGRPAAHPQQPGADRCAALDLERGHDRVAIQPQHVDPLNGLGGHPVELLRQLLTAAGHIPSRCPFHTRLWSFLATWTSKPISAPSLTGRYWISAWPLTAASGFLAARGLVILRHRHPAVGRPGTTAGLWRILASLPNGRATGLACASCNAGQRPHHRRPSIWPASPATGPASGWGCPGPGRPSVPRAYQAPEPPCSGRTARTIRTRTRLGKTRELQIGAPSKSGSLVFY